MGQMEIIYLVLIPHIGRGCDSRAIKDCSVRDLLLWIATVFDP